MQALKVVCSIYKASYNAQTTKCNPFRGGELIALSLFALGKKRKRPKNVFGIHNQNLFVKSLVNVFGFSIWPLFYVKVTEKNLCVVT